MRILKYKNKLVEEIGNVENKKVVHLVVIRDEDKDRCPHCDKPVRTEISIVEDCPNWFEDIKGIDTL